MCVGRNLAGELELLLPAGGGARKIFSDPVSRSCARSYAEPKMAAPHLYLEGQGKGVERPFSVNIKSRKIAAPHLYLAGQGKGVERRFSVNINSRKIAAPHLYLEGQGKGVER